MAMTSWTPVRHEGDLAWTTTSGLRGPFCLHRPQRWGTLPPVARTRRGVARPFAGHTRGLLALRPGEAWIPLQGHGPPYHHQLIHAPQGSTHASRRLQAKLPAQAARRTETKPKGTVCTTAGVKVSAVHTNRPQPAQSARRLQNDGGHNGHCAR